jgi:hypothetical protein
MTDTTSPDVLYAGVEFIAEALHEMRGKVLTSLTDADLEFAITGNPTLGELLADFASVEDSYANSFTDLKQDWSSYKPMPALTSVTAYQATFNASFSKVKTALSGYTTEQGKTVTVNRGGWEPTLIQQFDTYAQAVLIIFGKLTIYLRAMGKELPERWTEWVG